MVVWQDTQTVGISQSSLAVSATDIPPYNAPTQTEVEGDKESNGSSPWQSDRSASYHERQALRHFDLHYGQDPARRPSSESSDFAPVSSPLLGEAAIDLMTRAAARREYEERQATLSRSEISSTTHRHET